MNTEQTTIDGSEYIESTSDEWETPQEIFDKWNEEYNFTLDPCCTIKTAKTKKFYTKEDGGLWRSWEDKKVWMNPPYSDIPKWLEKATKEVRFNNCPLVVALLPAWTDRDWFHKYILHSKATIHFLKGRIRFLLNGKKHKSPRFGSMVVVFK